MTMSVCWTIVAYATSIWYDKWFRQLSAVYLRNQLKGIESTGWGRSRVVVLLTSVIYSSKSFFKNLLWLNETLERTLNQCDPLLCNKLFRCLQSFSFSQSQTSFPTGNRWHASCIHTTPYQAAQLQHSSSLGFFHPPLWLRNGALLGTQWDAPVGRPAPRQLCSSVVQQQEYQTVRNVKNKPRQATEQNILLSTQQ